MSGAALLSPTDIHVIRRYVHTKYAPLPGHRQAEIVADAIRRTLQQRLPNLPVDFKHRLVEELITRCLVSEQREVIPEDVLDICAELDDKPIDHKDELIEPILSWLNERSPGGWSAEQLASRLVRGSIHSAAPIAVPIASIADAGLAGPEALPNLPRIRLPAAGWALLAGVVVCAVATGLFTANPFAKQPVANPPVIATPLKADIGMPDRLKYTDIDTAALKSYLKSRESMLAAEPYFGAIVEAAKVHNVHPLLLFAITGQEQGFVPKSNKNAHKIANNPFNVFHSWQDYNTTIHKSAGIAGRTIARRAQKRPEGYEPFAWLNETYAEDPLWQDGVRQIFDKLNSLTMTP
ncbi:hypothetical protein [Cohnella kolymensis]|uniref:hypothetical protein n=1 Tax=Cohnella kolymensis TaxID=1590652 RepID=UPI000698496D|nr:hypothetical protein [Cohnella kolymensis]